MPADLQIPPLLMPAPPLYSINPHRDLPWNALPDLPIDPALWRTAEVLEQLGLAQEALGRLHGRSIAIPNQGLLINTISLQEAKASSAIENIFTTDDELYRALSATVTEPTSSPAKEVLRYREALWKGYAYLADAPAFSRDYFVHILREVKQTQEGFAPLFPKPSFGRAAAAPTPAKPFTRLRGGRAC